MSRLSVSVALLVLISVFAVSVAAQQGEPKFTGTSGKRPSLVGTWTLVPEKSLPANAYRPASLTLAHDGQLFTENRLAEVFANGVRGASYPISITYTTDGEEHPTPKPSASASGALLVETKQPNGPVNRLAIVESSYRATWTVDQLVIITRFTSAMTSTVSNEQKYAQRHVTRQGYSVDADGLLVVEAITVVDPIENGPSYTPVPMRSVYRASSGRSQK